MQQKKIWYGYSEQNDKVHFFNSDPGTTLGSNLSGVGSFTINGDTTGLNIENVPQSQSAGQTQTA